MSLEGKPHPWEPDYARFQNVVLPKLKPIGFQIGEAARQEDPDAMSVMRYYELLYRSFDPLMLICLEEALDRYIDKTK